MFKSGFEGDVRVSPNLDHLIGTDKISGFRWPDDLINSGLSDNEVVPRFVSPKFIYLTSTRRDIETKIVNVKDRFGNRTKALLQAVKGNHRDPNIGATVRNEYDFYPTDLKQSYIRMWVKTENNIHNRNRGGWHMFMEWKEPHELPGGDGSSDWRMNIGMKFNDVTGKYHWDIRGEQMAGEGPVCSNQCREWRYVQEGTANAEAAQLTFIDAPPVPAGRWFQIEVFWRKGDENTGRLWFAVDGEVIVDHQGRTQHGSKTPASDSYQFWAPFKVYTSTGWHPVQRLIDDVEIWSDFPAHQ